MEMKLKIDENIRVIATLPEEATLEEVKEIIKKLDNLGAKEAEKPKRKFRSLKKKTNIINKWTDSEIDFLKGAIERYLMNKRISVRGMTVIRNRLKRHSNSSILSKIDYLKKKGIVKSNSRNMRMPKEKDEKKEAPDNKEIRRKLISDKVKELMRLDPSKSYNQAYYMARQTIDGNRKKIEVSFKKFEGLDYDQKNNFWMIMKVFLERGTLQVDDVSALKLKDGLLWDIKTWENFCGYLMQNSWNICDILGFERKKFVYDLSTKILNVR